jgi:protein gp37
VSGNSAIEWTDATWNPIVGCERVSPGCDHCYAERLTAGRLAGVPVYAGLTEGGKWTGEVRCLPQRLEQPLHWKKPRRIFVNSMSDLFHPEVLSNVHERQPFLAHVFARMVAAKQHQFQVLTKRPQLMAGALRHPMFKLDVNSILMKLGFSVMPGGMSEPDTPWPRHLWLGTSIESDRYCFRADYLRQTPAAIRFLSLEPLLGPLPSLDLSGIDWVIVGGESGPGARPMHPEWVRDLRDRCGKERVRFLFKQWGEWGPALGDPPELVLSYDGRTTWTPESDNIPFFERKCATVVRRGKAAAGRMLDGRTWDRYPE